MNTNKKVKSLRFSIRLTVVTMFLMATVLMAVVAIGLQYVFSKNLATESSLGVYQQAAQATQDHLEAMDRQASQAAGLLARQPGLTSDRWVTGRAREVFSDTLKRNPFFYAIYIGFDTGDFFELVNLDASPVVRKQIGAEASDRWVVITVSAKPGERLRQFHYYDKAFNLRTSRVESTDYDATARPWYIAAGLHGHVSKTGPYQFQHLQAPGQTYSTYLQDGEGVLAVDIALSSVSNYLRNRNIGRDTDIYLFQRSGELIASNTLPQSAKQIPPGKQLSLDQEQAALVAKYPLLTVANELDWPPIDFAVSGQPRGYSIDMLAMISDMTGLKFDFVNGLTWADLVNLFERGELDVLQPVYGTEENARKGVLSKPFLHLPYGVVTRPGADSVSSVNDLRGKTVAIPRGWSTLPIIKRNFPDIEVMEVVSVRAMFDAVREGRADAGLDSAVMLRYSARRYFLSDIAIQQPVDVAGTGLPEDLHFLVRSDKSELVELLNLAIDHIDDRQRQALRAKWFRGPIPATKGGMGTVPYPELLTLSSQRENLNRLNRVDLDGEEHFVYLQPMGDTAEAGEYFAVVRSVSAVLGPAVAKVQTSLIYTAVCLLLVLPVSYGLAGLIVTPVKDLAEENRKIMARDYKALTPVGSRIVEIEELAESMTEMARAIERHAREQEELMEAFFALIAQAIDDKSPYTAKHCARVPELALMLARAANDCDDAPFGQFQFATEQQWREFRIGAWLHDCGKITTPEHIIDKGTKLEANYNRIHEVRMRFEVLWRDAEIDFLRCCQQEPAGAESYRAELEKRQLQLREDFAFIASCNQGGEFLDDSAVDRLRDIAAETWLRNFDDRLGLSRGELERFNAPSGGLPVTENLLADKPEHIIARDGEIHFPERLGIRMDVPEHLYNLGEIYNLSVSRGTLSAEDRFKINEHIISTIKMLDSLPFPDELAMVPRYASTHHETLNGTGYPRKLTADDLSVPERIMVLADIFEALTARDRPYKPAKNLSQALAILRSMVEEQHVDGDVFALFLRSGVYMEYARRFLPPEQIDEVDISQYLA